MNDAARPAAAVPALPLFWPTAAAAAMFEAGAELSARSLAFLAEEEKLAFGTHPALATPSRPLLDLRTMVLRDYSRPDSGPNPRGLPTLVDAPYAGHSAMIADYQPGQSLMETLRGNGLARLYLTDWKSAGADMRDLEIDQYLAELNVCVDEVGGRANLVGLCQGGWMAAMYAARFPAKVASLVLAGAPIDTDAGDGPIRQMVQTYPESFYEELVALGGGLMRGRFMLMGWKAMHPEQHFVAEPAELYQHLDDAAYLKKKEAFDSWYEHPIDLPGRWYLQVIRQIFRENRLAKGRFVALGRRLDLKTIRCPLYLLAGESDDITTREQILDAAPLFGTSAAQRVTRLVPGGHIGLFMGSRTLATVWPEIARWIAAVE